MKKYLVFLYYTYYPCGGIDDFEDSFDTFEEAEKCVKDRIEKDTIDCYQIVDYETLQIIKQERII